jgi:hypothetical protein
MSSSLKQAGTLNLSKSPYLADRLFNLSNDSKKLVVWTIDKPHPVRLSIDAPSVMVVSMTGVTQALTPINRVIEIELIGSPQYVLIAT